MSARKEPGRPPPPRPQPPDVRPDSLVLVNTGDGKGKSTAAFGVVMRAVSREWRVCVIQFIKSDRWRVGEEKIARQLGVDWLKGGDGFTWESPDLDKSEGRAAAAWKLAASVIAEGEHQLVVLDEITYPMNYGWIDPGEVIEAIRSRPPQVNIIATCRDAYEKFAFHRVYHALNHFCAVDLSSLYIDITKDRLYCDAPDSMRRRATQTAVWHGLSRSGMP